MMSMNSNAGGMGPSGQIPNGGMMADNMNMPPMSSMGPAPGPMMNPGMRNMNNMPGMMNNMGGMQQNMNMMNSNSQMQMQYNNSNGMGYNNMGQMNHINMGRMGHMSNMNSMNQMHNMMQNMSPRPMNMMGSMSSREMNNMANMPIRAGGPSINMRMPMDPHSRMFGNQGRPSPYPNPQMYMTQKRHQAPMYNNQMQGMGPMGPNNGQYMSRGPFPQGYPMSHPHNMGGGPGPGFAGGMPPNMRHGNMMPNNMQMSSMGSSHQNFPMTSQHSSSGMGPGPGPNMNPAMRSGGHSGPPAGPGGHGPYPGSGGGGGGGNPGPGMVNMGGTSPGMFPGRIKTEVPNMSPRGGGGPGVGSGISSFQHSPVPGNPTPPLTPNGPTNCISAPFASPTSDQGSSSPASNTSQDIKPNFTLASE